MYFDRFDICAAWYLHLAENHEGQWSEKYERLSRLLEFFTPSPSLRVSSLSDNALAIYEQLSEKG